MLVKEKVHQATGILSEYSIDCWITFVRETSVTPDPMLPFLSNTALTWHSAFIITRKGETWAIVGQMEVPSIEDLEVYDHVIGYVEGIKGDLLRTLSEINPSAIALNFSSNSEIADGLTHGMYLTFLDMVSEIGMKDRIVSSEKVVSSLRARKTDYEISRIRRAIQQTEEIFDRVKSFISPGKSELEIAAFMANKVEEKSLDFAWGREHCPAVFTGPDTAGAHYTPTERKVEEGHILNMDFGVKVDGYCSDLQRTFYILETGQKDAPEDVRRGFETIVTSIELAYDALRPGVQGREIDSVAREFIVSSGYEEFPHALGHQVGQFAHDGTALLGPTWEKYRTKPFEPLEEGMVFTIEPRLMVPGRGVVTIEEMVVVTASGAEYLSTPQKELILIG